MHSRASSSTELLFEIPGGRTLFRESVLVHIDKSSTPNGRHGAAFAHAMEFRSARPVSSPPERRRVQHLNILST